MAKERVFMGVYSGAAADGADAALLAVTGKDESIKARLLGHVHCPFPEELRRRIAAASGGPTAAVDIASLDCDVALAFAAAAESLLGTSKVEAVAVQAVGCSGQLLACDAPRDLAPGSALIVGNSALLARRTGIVAVGGFALSDLAGGGLGLPCGWADWMLLHHKTLSRASVHLGGIASIVFLGAGAGADETVAFDVGPGTMVMDALTRQHLQKPCDEDGAAAARGKVNAALLHELASHEFYRLAPPKVASPGDWGHVYITRLGLMAEKHRCTGTDLLTTVTEMTARAVAAGVGQMTERPHEVILSGGGARNIHLAARIRTLLCPCSTVSSEKFGLGVSAKQAACYAMLAAARLDETPIYCCSAAGPTQPAIVGSVFLP